MRTALTIITLFNFLLLCGQDRPFITTWKTDNPGGSCQSCISIPTKGTGYDYEVDWDMDGIYDEQGITGDVTHDFGIPGTYTIAIRGSFPTILFGFIGVPIDAEKILSIDQWGDIEWKTFNSSFFNCLNLLVEANDVPDLSAVEDMNDMFRNAISLIDGVENWDVSNVKDLSGMFTRAISFTGDLTDWDVSGVTDMSFMFQQASSMVGSLKNWDVSSVVDMTAMFNDASNFNGDINSWDVSSVTEMDAMFQGASSMASSLKEWDVSSVVGMRAMFDRASNFNGEISSWDVSRVNEMAYMFASATSFDLDLSTWDVSSVTDISYMFRNASSFNQDLSTWDVSSVTDMVDVFRQASSFDQDLSTWDVSSVTDMGYMFSEASSFNQDLSTWDVSSVTNMIWMFSQASSFNQDLSTWDLSSIQIMAEMLNNSGMDQMTYENTLEGWSVNPSTPDGITLGSENLEYCDETGRDLLLAKGWTIEGDSKADEEDCLTDTERLALVFHPHIYPVPAHQTIQVANLDETCNYKILDKLGETISVGSYFSGRGINVDHLPTGHYILIVETPDQEYPLRFIKY